MIPFNKVDIVGNELNYVADAVKNKISGDGKYSKACSELLEQSTRVKKVLLTTSCTHALEMAAILLDLHENDEVIMPSYTFVSTANAFALRGAKIIFVDINPKTMNIDENAIEKAITKKTKVIVVVHYGGVGCNMDKIMNISKKYNLKVVEDAAQGVNATYKNKFLGSIADIGCYSFHETKNLTCGEGGAILLRDHSFVNRAEIIREKGTNRSEFYRGEIDKYTWVDIGSSYLMSDINAAFLYGQIEKMDVITEKRIYLWNLYNYYLKNIIGKVIGTAVIPSECKHNGHMFYIKVKNIGERQKLIKYLKNNGVIATFHYIPLHSTLVGSKYGRFNGEDFYTTVESERILRLPMYFSLTEKDIKYIARKIEEFYGM